MTAPAEVLAYLGGLWHEHLPMGLALVRERLGLRCVAMPKLTRRKG